MTCGGIRWAVFNDAKNGRSGGFPAVLLQVVHARQEQAQIQAAADDGEARAETDGELLEHWPSDIEPDDSGLHHQIERHVSSWCL